jgi:LmbE family N-acetylglucosaminyl deacetylase
MKSLPMKSCAVLAFVVACSLVLAAQEPEPATGLVALHQARLDAQNDLVVLNVAAHPDDESSRTNTMLRRKHGMRVVTVYTTYGDGGQNAIGREIGPELAGLRVHETLRAAGMLDVEVRWLGMADFGFSKTLEETLAIWGEEPLRAAMRAVIDAVEPDVVITNHSLTQGHGHHRASIWAALEVLRERQAAGRHAPPLLQRCGLEAAQLLFDPSEVDPARGVTYARLAHRAWTQHVTQGPWGPHDPLQVGKDFWRVAFPEGDGAAVPGIASPASWGTALPRAAGRAVLAPQLLPSFGGDGGSTGGGDLDAWAHVLRTARAELAAATASEPQGAHRAAVLQRRIDAIERAMLATAGVFAEVWLERDVVAHGAEGAGFVVVHGSERVDDLRVTSAGGSVTAVQAAVRPTPFDGMAATPAGAVSSSGPATAPAPPAPDAAAARGRYRWTFPCAARDAGPEPSFATVQIAFELGGEPFRLERRLPYTPAPPLELVWDREVLLVPAGQRSERLLSVRVRAHAPGDAEAAVRLSMGPGIQAMALPGRLSLSAEQNEARLLVRATIDAAELVAGSGLEVGFAGPGFGSHAARLPVRVVDVSIPPGLRVGLVRGPDDTTERALADLGIDYTALDRDALVTARLEQFSALLLDIRAYHHRPELEEVRERVLQYCRAGGRVVAMYHKPGEWNERKGHPLLAPFPLHVANERVTEEDAAVEFLQPQHRLMHYPHKLGAADFDGWVQERGLNFPDKWDPAWTPMLSMRDRGDEQSHQGALLYTQYGRGDYVYCSLVLYRQLRVGNEGAARLLVNLLAK